jgi:hypothetical protein
MDAGAAGDAPLNAAFAGGGIYGDHHQHQRC